MSGALRFALACSLFSIPACAQRAQLSGVIKDASAAVITNAAVSVLNQSDGVRRTVRSGTDGSYSVAGLPPGEYKITIRKPGFQTVVRLGLVLEASEAAALDFILPVGSVREIIVVKAAPAPANAEDGAVGTILERSWLDALALGGRSLMGAIDLLPGVLATPATAGEAGQFTINGQRPNTNHFTVDGMSANNAVSGGALPAQFGGATLPATTAFGSLHAISGNDEIQQVRIQTSSFAPEFGRMPGGQIAITTRSGTNGLHGSVSYGFRHEALTANDWFANRETLHGAPLRFSNAAGALGGSLRRNREFFFVATEGIRLREPQIWHMVVPSVAARSAASGIERRLLDAFPVAPAAELRDGTSAYAGVSSRPIGMESGSARLDLAPAPQLTVFARYSQTPSRAEVGYSQVNRSRLAYRSATLGGTVFIGSSWIQDVRVNASAAVAGSDWFATGQGGAQPFDPRLLFPSAPSRVAAYGVAIRGVGQLIFGAGGRNRQGQLQIVNTVTRPHERHSVAFGVDYLRLTPSRQTSSTTWSAIYASLHDVLARRPPIVNYAEADQASSLIESLSVFAQDVWRPRAGLAVTYGLRWELTPAPAIREPFGPLAAGPAAARLWPTRYGQFAPRIGIAYRAAERLILRAGYGLFYDAAFGVATDPINGFPFNRWQFSSGTFSPVDARLGGGRFAPDLRLPYSHEWNVAVERAMTEHEALSLSYVGASARRLLRREGTRAPGTDLVGSAVGTNNGWSDAHGLQVQYRRRLDERWAAVAAITWSHAIDNGSFDSGIVSAGPDLPSDKGASSFDVRHVFSAGIVCNALRRWTASGTFRARSGFPIDVTSSANALGLGFDNFRRPDLVSGTTLWLDDRGAPGGRRLNPAAFQAPEANPETSVGRLPGQTPDLGASQPADTNRQGSLGRNAIRGFGMWQLDAAVSRCLVIRENVGLELRLEAYNVLNHPNFSDPVRYLDSPMFGFSTSMLNRMLGLGAPYAGLAPALQVGGPRSLQATIRARF